MEFNKKKRSCNYTAAEKQMLLDLVKRYQHILENKKTNAQMIIRKRETWGSVCQQYNAVAVSGSRTWQQLRHLYENVKQRSKNNIANTNKEINRKGCGAYKTTHTGRDDEILAIAGSQIKPYNGAAFYFGDTKNDQIQDQMDTASEDIIIKTELGDQDTPMANISWIPDNELCTVLPIIAGSKDKKTTGERNSKKPSTVTNIVTSNIKDDPEVTTPINKDNNKFQRTTICDTKRKTQQRLNKNTKEEYFKMKLRNAKLEYKFLINRNRMEINKYNIEMQIFKFKLKKLQSPRPLQKRNI